MYEDLIPEVLLRGNDIKLQVFNSFTDGFHLHPDTEFVVINLKSHHKWYNRILNLHFLADAPKWACVHSMFQEACTIICSEMKDVTIHMRHHTNGSWVLQYDIRDLNRINGRESPRYPYMPIEWRSDSFITVLPVYFFKPIEKAAKIERKFTIVNN